jgi:DNA-binding NtrC family response regulator
MSLRYALREELAVPPQIFQLEILGEEDGVAPVRLAEGSSLVVGRGAGCDVVLEGRGVSRQHARLEVVEGTLRVTDLESAAGTRVRGRFVSTASLEPGDTVEIGEWTFEVRSEQAPASHDPDRLLRLLTRLLSVDGADPAGVLGEVLSELLEVFGADRSMIFQPDTTGALVCHERALSAAGEDLGETQVSRGLLASVAEEGTPRLLTTLETLELREDAHPSIPSQLCSILAAPLPTPGGVGVLYLDSLLERRRFDVDDRARLLAFAEAAGGALRRIAAAGESERERDRLAELHRRDLASDQLLGTSPAWVEAVADLHRAADTGVTVMIHGESGTGKELLARELHRASGRRGSFVAVHCASLPATLVESELFGHVAGAFSGATQDRPGLIELAAGGTLFLDEVGEIPLATQATLLRVLETRQVRRVGGERDLPVDFRLVGATHANLDEAVAAGKFRADLLYRLRVYEVRPPPLRARGDDVHLLAREFLWRFAREQGKVLEGFAEDALEALAAHPWPGNVRELRNVVEQAAVRVEAGEVKAADLAGALAMISRTGSPTREMARYPSDLGEARKIFERTYIEFHLQCADGVVATATGRLGITRRAFYRKCRLLGVDLNRFRRGAGSAG